MIRKSSRTKQVPTARAKRTERRLRLVNESVTQVNRTKQKNQGRLFPELKRRVQKETNNNEVHKQKRGNDSDSSWSLEE